MDGEKDFSRFFHAVLLPRSYLLLASGCTRGIDIFPYAQKLERCLLYYFRRVTTEKLLPLIAGNILFPSG